MTEIQNVVTSTLVAAAHNKAVQAFALSFITNTGKSILKAFHRIEDDYGDHLSQSYERCSKIRTVLNRDSSTSLLGLYVNITFKSENTEIDDFDLIQKVRDEKRIIVSGTGGGGKTIFMKYLWLSLFEKPQGKIPIFVELRRFNDITSDDFETFLLRSMLSPSSKLQKTDYTEALKAGAFVFIFDGFDELLSERRKTVELAILDLSKNYRNIGMVVSGRQDDRFSGWSAFSNYRVNPMNQAQIVKLIERLTYDPKIKKKFITRVKKDLFESHTSFLSNPLLATMMLLTFDQFADIPEKIHLFYDQTFDTLFAKHDATKEAYKRQIHSGLPIDIFKKVLSFVSLFSYYDGKYEISEGELLGYIRSAVDFLKLKSFSSEDFMKDLIESVCVFQKDGIKLVYSHRSFQEFFAAFCLARHIDDRVYEICKHIAGRPSENTLEMFLDMNRDAFERKFALPAAKALEPDSKSRFYPELRASLRMIRNESAI